MAETPLIGRLSRVRALSTSIANEPGRPNASYPPPGSRSKAMGRSKPLAFHLKVTRRGGPREPELVAGILPLGPKQNEDQPRPSCVWCPRTRNSELPPMSPGTRHVIIAMSDWLEPTRYLCSRERRASQFLSSGTSSKASNSIDAFRPTEEFWVTYYSGRCCPKSSRRVNSCHGAFSR